MLGIWHRHKDADVAREIVESLASALVEIRESRVILELEEKAEEDD